MPAWSPEQIIALAPDPSSAKAGKELASLRKWVSLGTNEEAAWGECQGSGKDPYQTQIDLSEPAFKCSCPSRKFPCKHALGLFLLLALQSNEVKQKTPPPWVAEWLVKRAQSAQKQAKEKTESALDPMAQVRRAAKREERVRLGVEDLDLWLSDLVRQGLSAVQSQPLSFWEVPAARLVDAQAPGLARRVRELAWIPGSGEGWQGRLLAQIGKLYLLVRGFAHLDHLPLPTQADVRTQIGWTQDQDELLQQEGVRDRWLVLGMKVDEETVGALGRSSFLKAQRTWLVGEETHRPALILNFAAPGQVLEPGQIPGTSLDAELVFFSGGFPLRALVKKQFSAPIPQSTSPSGFPGFGEAVRVYSAALASNPWLDLFPMLLNSVTPEQNGGTWGLHDIEGRFLPFSTGFSGVWTLMALSGGYPIDLFCVWNGETLWPHSVWADGRFVLLQSARKEG